MKSNKILKQLSKLGSVCLLVISAISANAQTLPGKIEAENSSSQNGTRTQTTADVGGGLNVGWISSGDYLSFNTNVEHSGRYTFEFRVATPRTGSLLDLRVNGSSVAYVNVPTTGDWQTWQSVSTEIELNAGSQTMDLHFSGTYNGDLLNLNWFEASFLGGNTVVMQKQNTSFSIDGNKGAVLGQEVYLWSTNTNNVNQQWIEVGQSGGYYSYQKSNTGLCLDGGDGGALRQPITLEVCDDNDQNQHWQKVSLSNGSFRLQKRGTNFSIDGNWDGENGQPIYLWSSSDSNVNQQWQFFSVGDGGNSDYEIISSIDELKEAFAQSNGKFKMQPGYYTVTSLLADSVTILRTTGSNNIFDFSGVTINIPTTLLSQMSGATHTYAEWKVEGNDNTFINGTFINTYPNGEHSVTDYRAHNENSASGRAPGGSSTFMRIWGDRNTFINNTITVRGSFPYGYGEIYGKGSGSYFGQKKHSGIQIVGDNTLIDGLNLTQLAFGHGIFMQGADDTTILNSNLQGEVRLGADMYNDGSGSLPDQSGYQQYSPEWRQGPIPHNKMFALTEDGIRAYASGTKLDGSSANTGSVFIENTNVTNLRSCIALVAASEPAYINNVEVRGCEDAFSLPRSGGHVINSRADAAFGHLIGMPYGNEGNSVYDITLIEAPYQVGDHFLAHIAGSNHDITIRSSGASPSVNRPIKIGYAWDRWDVTGDVDRHGANGVSITNHTQHEVELTQYSSNTSGSSVGNVRDYGSNNNLGD